MTYMKNKIIMGLMSLFLVIGVYHLAENNLEVDYIPDVMAVTATATPSAACTDPTISAFQGDIDTTITWSAPGAAAASTPSCSTAINAQVHSEAAPACTPTLNATGGTSGFVVVTYTFPRGKIAGNQCQTGVDDSKLEVHGDGVNNTSFDVAVSNLADADNIYTAADQVDTAAATAKDVLFGALGQISTTLLLDGTRDDDAILNGESVWGGAATEANGGMQNAIMVDVTEYNTTAATDTETITITATGS